jgi:hypothetical protein
LYHSLSTPKPFQVESALYIFKLIRWIRFLVAGHLYIDETI